jgi:hypothetical protein
MEPAPIEKHMAAKNAMILVAILSFEPKPFSHFIACSGVIRQISSTGSLVVIPNNNTLFQNLAESSPLHWRRINWCLANCLPTAVVCSSNQPSSLWYLLRQPSGLHCNQSSFDNLFGAGMTPHDAELAFRTVACIHSELGMQRYHPATGYFP